MAVNTRMRGVNAVRECDEDAGVGLSEMARWRALADVADARLDCIQ